MIGAYNANRDIDMVIGNYLSIPEKNLITGDNIKKGMVDNEEFIDVFMENIRSYYIGVPWNKLYKRELIERYDIRFNKNVVWCEDFLFNIEYFDKCRLFYLLYVEEGVYKYILRENSITHSIKKQDNRSMMKDIDELRYIKAKEYCEKNGNGNIFELEWNCSNVYAELSELTKVNSDKSLAECYMEFIKILRNPQIHEYINMKSKKTDIFIWKIMDLLIKKEQYRVTFLIFLIKGFMVTNMGTMACAIKKKVKHYVPPNL